MRKASPSRMFTFVLSFLLAFSTLPVQALAEAVEEVVPQEEVSVPLDAGGLADPEVAEDAPDPEAQPEDPEDADNTTGQEPNAAVPESIPEPESGMPEGGGEGIDDRTASGDIASGTWGTCPWVITSEGELIVYGGEGKSQEGRTSSPWSSYASSITSVSFGGDGGITTAPDDSRYLLAGLYDATTIDVAKLGTSGVTNMEGMFSGCRSLTTLIEIGENNVGCWDTTSVTNMSRMFRNCSSLTEFDFILGLGDEWNTRNVTDMSEMFYGCSHLASVDLSEIIVSQLRNISGMFYDCSSLKSLEIPFFWSDAPAEDISYMFYGCSGLVWVDLTELHTGLVTSMAHMFEGCSRLTTIYAGGIFANGPFAESEGMFEGCTELVGCRGTVYDPDYVDDTRARVDSDDNPGYLWYLVSGNSQEDDIASGTWGTCPWEISADGTLTIHPGVGGNSTHGRWGTDRESYWYPYRNKFTSVVFAGDDGQKVISPKDSSSLFAGLERITKIDASHLVVSRTTNMSDMFYYCTSLASLDLSGWDTSNVKDMSNMFHGCHSLSSLDLSSFDTSSVTDMSHMFETCSSLSSIDLSPLDTSSVTDMSYLFSGCSSLASIDLSPLDTSSVTDMSHMFEICSSLSSIDLSPLDTSSVTNMRFMFALCHSLSSIDLSVLDISSVISMEYMFYSCGALASIGRSSLDISSVGDISGMFKWCSSLASLDVSGWDTSSVSRMSELFSGCYSLSSLDVSNWDTSNVTYMDSVFYGCSSLSDLDVSSWDTSSAVDMSWMFEGCRSLVSLDVSAFNTSSVENLGGMFYGCSSLSSLDVSSWDTSNVTSMDSVFSGCASLADLDVSSWDTSSAVDMSEMFEACDSLVSLDVSGWDTSSVTSMNRTFSDCSSLTTLDVSRWDTSSVTDMGWLFSGCSSLSTLDVSGWDTSSVTDMQWLFTGCSSLSSIDVSKWETSLVTDMNSMFSDCSSVRLLDVSRWDTSQVTNMASMFGGCPSLESLDVSSFDTSSVTNMGWMFGECSSLASLDLTSFDTSSVTRMHNMFCECSSLTELDLSSFDTSSVMNIDQMFSGCSSLEVIYAGDLWTIEQITHSTSIFDGCEALVGGCGTAYEAGNDYYSYAHIDTEDDPGYLTAVGQKIDISSAWTERIPNQIWTGSAITPAVTVLLRGRELANGKDYAVSYQDNVDCGIATVTVTGVGRYSGTITSTFQIVPQEAAPYGTWGTCPWEISDDGVLTVHPGVGASQEGKEDSPWSVHSEEITSVVFSSEDGKRVVLPEDSSYLLAFLDNVVSVDTSGLDISSVKSMQCMFYYCTSLSSIDVSGWDMSGVTSIRAIFSQCYALTSLDVSGWDTSNVTTMRAAFHTCSALEGLDVSGWDTSSVTSMYGMFSNCSSLDVLDVSGWDTSNVADMSFMFFGCTPFTTLDLSSWDTSSVTEMLATFQDCTSLVSLDISSWDTSSVTDMRYLFYNCPDLTTVYAGEGWTTAAVNSSEEMFYECTSLVGGNGTAYDANHIDAEYARIDASGAPGYFSAKPADLIDISAATVDAIADQTYDGTAKRPVVTVRLGGSALAEGTDYTVAYSNNVNAGIATVTVTGKGAYTGTKTATFTILKAKVEPPTAIGSLVYNGSEQTGVAEAAGYALSGTYTATDAGFYTAIAELADLENSTWTDGTTETKYIRWNIARAEIEPPTAATGLVYNGGSQTGVAAGTGYTLSGTFAATAAGDYEAVATLDANHCWPGSVTADYPVAWSIAKADIATATIAAIPDQSFTGSAITPAVTVRLGGTALKVGTDYTVSYSNNTAVGTATVTVTGRGNFSGTKTATFRIVEDALAPENPFRDVSEKTGHYEDILWLAASGISAGWDMGDGTFEFRPYANVARADMAAFLCRLVNGKDYQYEPTADDVAYFADVNWNTPHCRDIWWLASQGISRGWTEKDGSHTFRPYANVARCDMACFLMRMALGSDAEESYVPSSADLRYFSDVNVGTSHRNAVLWLAHEGISAGWTVGSRHEFRPYANVARADMAAFLHRMDSKGLVPEAM